VNNATRALARMVLDMTENKESFSYKPVAPNLPAATATAAPASNAANTTNTTATTLYQSTLRH
jgi:hypothetical protein